MGRMNGLCLVALRPYPLALQDNLTVVVGNCHRARASRVPLRLRRGSTSRSVQDAFQLCYQTIFKTTFRPFDFYLGVAVQQVEPSLNVSTSRAAVGRE